MQNKIKEERGEAFKEKFPHKHMCGGRRSAECRVQSAELRSALSGTTDGRPKTNAYGIQRYYFAVCVKNALQVAKKQMQIVYL